MDLTIVFLCMVDISLLHVMFVLLHVLLHEFVIRLERCRENHLFCVSMSVAMTSYGTSETYWGMFPALEVQESVTVTGGCLKRGEQVAARRIDGRMYVLMEKKGWVSQAALGSSRPRSRLGRTATIDTLRAHATERMLTASAPGSALADEATRQLEEHLGTHAEGARPSKRSRVPLAGTSPGFVQELARLVAPPALGLPEDDAAFDVYVLPRPTAQPGIFVLASQVAARATSSWSSSSSR